MFSKKLTAVLVAVGVVASTSALFNEINIKTAFAGSVKQNVVYTKDDTLAASQDDGTGKVSGAEEEAYKEKSLDILKNYFNISVEENENFKFSACILNEKTLDEIKPKEQKDIQEAYDNKEISKEEYDKQMDFVEKNDDGLKNRVAKLKHGMVQTGWVGVGEDKCYMLDFNENTKEVDFVMVSEGIPKESDVPLAISEEQLKNAAEDFIKQNKLGDIEKPKCILVKGKHLFYQDENDSTKKVDVGINPFTGKVSRFSVKTYADLEYNKAINEK
ncbi:hypothetical protein FDC58_03325 [Clostridium botulinum]|uniref:hypothetical protein n=1 Tax=unclassified Clostridium TaxID=2614128 RepID=UPI000501EEBD|nr:MULTISPECIES: hypothetical protein [unclassified Clostridium]KFX56946.1 hypothetical protein KU41_10975 [Clostridium botulinum]KFX59473.1 hypothetical protein KU40_00385 [Clostridium botulinum]MBY6779438.1 hypothetical protein [Clostridium botulinum]MBY6802216.1 hypothetical protein [Clostridium botulinum]MBY6812356.1 hypothetical protein [Clostridium botulinum]